MKKLSLATTGVVIALSLAACAANETGADSTTQTSASSATLTGVIDAGGSSAQTAAQEAWRAGFSATNPGVTVNYDPTGSGTGRQNFASGGYVLAGTDAAFSPDEATGSFAACAPGSTLVEIPAYISAIAIGFNLDGVSSLKLDPATLAAVFAGTITNWNDPAIAATNPGVTLPDLTITAIHRSDKSGTTENFVDYLSQAAPAVWTWKVDQTWPTDLAGEAAEKTQGVRQAITATPGAIGYLDASQAKGMGTVAVMVGDTAVTVSATAAAAAVGASPLETGRSDTDVVVALDRSASEGEVYPVVLVSYLAACGTYADANVATLVKSYLSYVVSESGQAAAAANAGSAPLTSDPTLAAKAAAAVAAIN